MDDMLETMYKAPGIGLAAIQIGILKRIIVIDVSKDKDKKPLFLINPETFLNQIKLRFMKKVVYLCRDSLPKLKDQLNVN